MYGQTTIRPQMEEYLHLPHKQMLKMPINQTLLVGGGSPTWMLMSRSLSFASFSGSNAAT